MIRVYLTPFASGIIIKMKEVRKAYLFNDLVHGHIRRCVEDLSHYKWLHEAPHYLSTLNAYDFLVQ